MPADNSPYSELSGKRAFVTGGAQGIGRAIARRARAKRREGGDRRYRWRGGPANGAGDRREAGRRRDRRARARLGRARVRRGAQASWAVATSASPTPASRPCSARSN